MILSFFVIITQHSKYGILGWGFVGEQSNFIFRCRQCWLSFRPRNNEDRGVVAIWLVSFLAGFVFVLMASCPSGKYCIYCLNSLLLTMNGLSDDKSLSKLLTRYAAYLQNSNKKRCKFVYTKLCTKFLSHV